MEKHMWYVCACQRWIFGNKPLWLARITLQLMSCMHPLPRMWLLFCQSVLIGLENLNVHRHHLRPLFYLLLSNRPFGTWRIPF